MGLTQVPGKVKRPDGRGAPVRIRFLVDTGALYTVLPERVWRALRLKPMSTAEFGLADGTAIVRAVSEARFEIARRTATSPVVWASETTRRCSAPSRSRPSVSW